MNCPQVDLTVGGLSKIFVFIALTHQFFLNQVRAILVSWDY